MPSFVEIGASLPERPPGTPVVLSVPHAGRDYPPALLAALRPSPAALVALEDRHVDAVALAARGDTPTLIQRLPRAWIDLNRDEADRDPQVEEGVRGPALRHPSSKVRSGLGLVPRRAGPAGDLWRRRFAADEIAARIEADHRPYHRRLEALLDAVRARFGTAVLLDLHSMPPLPGRAPARVVVGDRFGRSAAARLVARVEGAARAAGHRTALNVPYAGGHLIERHGRPAAGIHAIQLEIDRTLYLDAALDRPGPGLEPVAAMVRAAIDALVEEIVGTAPALAAE